MTVRGAALERNYQSKLIKKIKTRLPDCEILKNDSSYLQGILDLSIFYGRLYAMLEVKREYAEPGSDAFEPNQEWYIHHFNQMGFAACIYPENEAEVLNELFAYLEDQ